MVAVQNKKFNFQFWPKHLKLVVWGSLKINKNTSYLSGIKYSLGVVGNLSIQFSQAFHPIICLSITLFAIIFEIRYE